METILNIKKWKSLLLIAVLSTLLVSAGQIAIAHETDCPVCELPVVQDTSEQDNETKMKVGRKRLEYRCVFCALSDAKNEFAKSDVTIAAPSEKKGEPVVIRREKDNWSVTPASAVFLAEKVDHRQCQVGYRAFSSKAALEAWAKKYKFENKPLSLSQMIEVAK